MKFGLSFPPTSDVKTRHRLDCQPLSKMSGEEKLFAGSPAFGPVAAAIAVRTLFLVNTLVKLKIDQLRLTSCVGTWMTR